MALDPKVIIDLARRKGLTVDELLDKRPEWMDRLHVERHPCKKCRHCDARPGSVKAALRTRGISETGERAGENTIAREFKWGNVMPRLHLLALCHIPDRSGSMLVDVRATCSHWAASRGRIWAPVSQK